MFVAATNRAYWSLCTVNCAVTAFRSNNVWLRDDSERARSRGLNLSVQKMSTTDAASSAGYPDWCPPLPVWFSISLEQAPSSHHKWVPASLLRFHLADYGSIRVQASVNWPVSKAPSTLPNNFARGIPRPESSHFLRHLMSPYALFSDGSRPVSGAYPVRAASALASKTQGQPCRSPSAWVSPQLWPPLISVRPCLVIRRQPATKLPSRYTNVDVINWSGF